MISSLDWGKMATCRQVTILLFAAAKEALNRSEIKLTIPNSPCSVKQLIHQLLPEKYPTLTEFLKFSQIALNCEYIDKNSDQLLQQGDEIAIIVPVSGG